MTDEQTTPPVRESLPYGVFRPGDGSDPRVGVRVAGRVVDLAAAASEAGRSDAPLFAQPSLNAFMAAGRDQWTDTRAWVVELTAGDVPSYAESDVTMLMPFEVGDYVDFYASEVHASNVGQIFRPDSPALPPNWKHLPIGYHGRSGTVVPSGTPVVQPCGQRRPGDDGVPPFGPSTKLDIECEVGFVIGAATEMGSPVPLSRARDVIFGVVLLNDWSARDIQAWEYVPLGPFLGKSFATSISAWVVPLDALADAIVPLPTQSPAVLPYLSGGPDEVFGLDLRLCVRVNGQVVSEPPYREMYWSPAQMLAHLTVNGASVRVGDLFASGTVSGREGRAYGSLLELTWNGTEPITLTDGRRLDFLKPGDTVELSGWAPTHDGGRLLLGEVTGTITPPRQ